MAVEQKRGCGYRKVGGLYMVGGGISVPCDRLPFELTVCSCCGQGIKQARGWTWIEPGKFFNGPHLVASDPKIYDSQTEVPCDCGIHDNISQLGPRNCPLCQHPESIGRAGLLWIGEKFYKTPDLFVKEGVEMGFSRRIQTVPRDFKAGETYVFLAHKNAIKVTQTGDNFEVKEDYKPGIFYAWLPQRLERIRVDSDQINKPEEIESDAKRGITAVFVPDDDKDHQGSVHDDFERQQRAKTSETEEEN